MGNEPDTTYNYWLSYFVENVIYKMYNKAYDSKRGISFALSVEMMLFLSM